MQWPDEESNSSAPVAEQYQQSSCGVSFASMFFVCFLMLLQRQDLSLGSKRVKVIGLFIERLLL